MTAGLANAGHVPLFDRLVDEEPTLAFEAVPLRTLSRDQLHLSIEAEVDRIVSTRCVWKSDELSTMERTVVNYGLPELVRSSSHSSTAQRRQLAMLIQSTIEAYEPRLSGVKVELRPPRDGTQGSLALVSGRVYVDEVSEPISFTVPLVDEDR